MIRAAVWQGRAPSGRWTGMLRVAGAGRTKVLAALEALRAREDFDSLGMPALLNQLVQDGNAPQVQYISGHWMDVNDLEDLQRAGEFAHRGGD